MLSDCATVVPIMTVRSVRLPRTYATSMAAAMARSVLMMSIGTSTVREGPMRVARMLDTASLDAQLTPKSAVAIHEAPLRVENRVPAVTDHVRLQEHVADAAVTHDPHGVHFHEARHFAVEPVALGAIRERARLLVATVVLRRAIARAVGLAG